MADTKISLLSAASVLDGTEIVPLTQSGVTVRTTAQDIADLGGSSSGAGDLIGRYGSGSLSVSDGDNAFGSILVTEYSDILDASFEWDDDNDCFTILKDGVYTLAGYVILSGMGGAGSFGYFETYEEQPMIAVAAGTGNWPLSIVNSTGAKVVVAGTIPPQRMEVGQTVTPAVGLQGLVGGTTISYGEALLTRLA